MQEEGATESGDKDIRNVGISRSEEYLKMIPCKWLDGISQVVELPQTDVKYIK